MEELTLILADVSLIAGAAYSTAKKIYTWALGFAAGALLLLAETIKALGS